MSENEGLLILTETFYLTSTLLTQYFISTDTTYLQYTFPI
jgi:hypothetical protein